MKKTGGCAVWGTNIIGQQTAIMASSLGYEVLIYCRSTLPSDKTHINGIPIVDLDGLKLLYNEKKVSHIILGVRNPTYLQEIQKHIENIFPDDVSVITQSEIENEYLKQERKNISYHWNVNFKNQAAIWIQNFMSEVDFWVQDVAKDTGIHHNGYLLSLSNKEFGGIFETRDELVRTLGKDSIVMDIGCGLVSKYGTKLPNHEDIQLYAVDPLAPFYNKINEKYAGREYTPTQFGLFEFISNFYERDYFDLILINNALDHCIDPWKSLIECLYVLKEGGNIRLSHRRAEASYEGYKGLHKWNIDYDEHNNLIIWNLDNAINVSEMLKNFCKVSVIYAGDYLPRSSQQITVYITKIKDFTLEQFIDVKDERCNLAFFVEQLMGKIADCTDNYLN